MVEDSSSEEDAIEIVDVRQYAAPQQRLERLRRATETVDLTQREGAEDGPALSPAHASSGAAAAAAMAQPTPQRRAPLRTPPASRPVTGSQDPLPPRCGRRSTRRLQLDAAGSARGAALAKLKRWRSGVESGSDFLPSGAR